MGNGKYMNREKSLVLDIIRENVYRNPLSLQCYSLSPDQIFQTYVKIITNDEMIYYRHNELVFLLQPFSNYMSQVHVFSCSKTNFVSNLKKLTCDIFIKSFYLKLFGITTNQQFIIPAERAGWLLNSVIEKSSIDIKGTLVDQYLFVASRYDYTDIKIDPVY